MKQYFCLIILLITFLDNAHSQDVTITYKMGVNNYLDAAVDSTRNYAYYKKDTVLTETSYSSTDFSKALITTHGSLVIMSHQGEKVFFNGPPGVNLSNVALEGINYIDSVREIAGYTCKLAHIKTKMVGGGGESFDEVWYTEQLPQVSVWLEDDPFKGLKGMPLEFLIRSEDMSFTITAINVSTAPIPSSVFQLSIKGYKEVKKEDMEKSPLDMH